MTRRRVATRIATLLIKPSTTSSPCLSGHRGLCAELERAGAIASVLTTGSQMKITKIATLAAVAALATSAYANDFEGAYVTLKGGLDHAKASGEYQADK